MGRKKTESQHRISKGLDVNISGGGVEGIWVSKIICIFLV